MKLLVLFVLISCVMMNALAGEHSRSLVMNSSQHHQLTGNLQIDFFSKSELTMKPMLQDEAILPAASHRKSPWLAAGLSAVVPGAGEFYAESYWKAGAFLAVDVALWILAANNDKKGDNQTNFFQNYANQNWSPYQYAEFSLRYVDPARVGEYRRTLFIPGTENRQPWERVNWNVLNAMEREISATPNGKYYSHTLPAYGEQQYFELIGKYQQFYQGWNDADSLLTTYDQIDQRLKSGGTKFGYYSIERGKANDFYTRAKTFVTVAIVNHVLSAIDAAWTASSFNKHLHASVRVQSVPTGLGYTIVPVAKVEYSF